MRDNRKVGVASLVYFLLQEFAIGSSYKTTYAHLQLSHAHPKPTVGVLVKTVIDPPPKMWLSIAQLCKFVGYSWAGESFRGLPEFLYLNFWTAPTLANPGCNPISGASSIQKEYPAYPSLFRRFCGTLR